MARLPSDKYLIQMLGDDSVMLFEDFTERQLVPRFSPADPEQTRPALKAIFENEELSDEDKIFAIFWVGYFFANAV